MVHGCKISSTWLTALTKFMRACDSTIGPVDLPCPSSRSHILTCAQYSSILFLLQCGACTLSIPQAAFLSRPVWGGSGPRKCGKAREHFVACPSTLSGRTSSYISKWQNYTNSSELCPCNCNMEVEACHQPSTRVLLCRPLYEECAKPECSPDAAGADGVTGCVPLGSDETCGAPLASGGLGLPQLDCASYQCDTAALGAGATQGTGCTVDPTTTDPTECPQGRDCEEATCSPAGECGLTQDTTFCGCVLTC